MPLFNEVTLQKVFLSALVRKYGDVFFNIKQQLFYYEYWKEPWLIYDLALIG